jgi:hypothetical protein
MEGTLELLTFFQANDEAVVPSIDKVIYPSCHVIHRCIAKKTDFHRESSTGAEDLVRNQESDISHWV